MLAFQVGGEPCSNYLASAVPGPPKEPKITAQYPKIGSIGGSIGSIILAMLDKKITWSILAKSSLRTLLRVSSLKLTPRGPHVEDSRRKSSSFTFEQSW